MEIVHVLLCFSPSQKKEKRKKITMFDYEGVKTMKIFEPSFFM
jgi:hypothetical protein